MTSAMINASVHVAAAIPTHVAQAVTVFEWRCFEFSKIRKKRKRVVTEEYSAPRKRMVGIAKEKATFL
jgi:hypothetical protein